MRAPALARSSRGVKEHDPAAARAVARVKRHDPALARSATRARSRDPAVAWPTSSVGEGDPAVAWPTFSVKERGPLVARSVLSASERGPIAAPMPHQRGAACPSRRADPLAARLNETPHLFDPFPAASRSNARSLRPLAPRRDMRRLVTASRPTAAGTGPAPAGSVSGVMRDHREASASASTTPEADREITSSHCTTPGPGREASASDPIVPGSGASGLDLRLLVGGIGLVISASLASAMDGEVQKNAILRHRTGVRGGRFGGGQRAPPGAQVRLEDQAERRPSSAPCAPAGPWSLDDRCALRAADVKRRPCSPPEARAPPGPGGFSDRTASSGNDGCRDGRPSPGISLACPR